MTIETHVNKLKEDRKQELKILKKKKEEEFRAKLISVFGQELYSDSTDAFQYYNRDINNTQFLGILLKEHYPVLFLATQDADINKPLFYVQYIKDRYPEKIGYNLADALIAAEVKKPNNIQKTSLWERFKKRFK